MSGATKTRRNQLSIILPAELAWLATKIRPLIPWLAGSFMFLAVSSAMALLNPLILKWLIDQILPGRNLSRIPFAVFLMFLSYEGRALCAGLGSYLTVYASQKMALDLRIDVLKHLDSLSSDYHENTPTGVKLYALREPIEEIATFGSDLGPTLLRALLSTVLTLSAMVVLSSRLTWIVLPLVPAFVVTRHHFRRRLECHAESVQAQRSAVSGFLDEHLSSVPQVQSLGCEKHRERIAFKFLAQAMRCQIRLARTGFYFTLATNMAIALAASAVVGFGSFNVLSGTLTIGGLVAFYSYLAQLFEPITTAMEVYARTQRTLVSIRQVRSTLDLKPSVAECPHAVALTRGDQTEMRFHNVRFGYRRDCDLLQLASLVIPPAQRLAIVGQNGAGKSTLAKLACRLYDPGAGTVSFGGKDMRFMQLKEIRSLIQYLPPDPVLFDDSLIHNLRLARLTATPKELEEVIAMVELQELIRSIPLGWKAPLGPGGCKLSSGERQRLALARALLRRPRVLILDEATSSLDASSEDRILSRLMSSMAVTTFFFVSHRFTCMKRFDRIVVLQGGRVVEEGSDSLLRSRNGPYMALLTAPSDQHSAPHASTSSSTR